MTAAPTVLVFDVNETLIELDAIAPVFEQIFGDARMVRTWFGQLVTYSMTAAVSENYLDFFTLGQGVLRMLGEVHGKAITEADLAGIRRAMLTMPAHPDVAEGLELLRDNGFRLVTLTNSPPVPDGPSPLQNAGLGGYFERQFSVDACRTFKPARHVYDHVCHELRVAPEDCMMVAAHVWDLIGAQSAGFAGALITRPGNAPLRLDGLPQPTYVANDLPALARQLARGAAASPP
ncbi:haloacid dehalogenase type II [Mycobacterium sp. NPDC048908]|uniref:haloacid dehalogenase type II n=1 Tax=Mycobacterium sp. NPDC048908 TaxID=3364292 RepID=UPI00371747F8